jgi:hypothetical protein
MTPFAQSGEGRLETRPRRTSFMTDGLLVPRRRPPTTLWAGGDGVRCEQTGESHRGGHVATVGFRRSVGMVGAEAQLGED